MPLGRGLGRFPTKLFFIPLMLVLGHGLFSVLWLPLTGAGLGDTEAYYASWAQDLCWGYHDHPGMIAWMLATLPNLPGTVGVRLIPFVLFFLTSVFLFGYWREMDSGRTAGLAALVTFVAIPIFGTGALLAAPDGPMAVFWALALVLAHRARGSRSLGGWGLVGVAAGLALASKFVAVWLLLQLFCLDAALAGGTNLRRMGRVLSVGLVGSLGFVPTLVFEMSHGWSGLRYHLFERHHGVAFAPANWLTFVGSQILVISPVLAILWAASVWQERRQFWADSPEGQALRLAVVPWSLLALMSVYTVEAEPHWPAMGYLPLLGLMAPHFARKRPRLWLGGVALGLTCQVVLWLHVALPLVPAIAPSSYVPRYDLANDLRGWDSLEDPVHAALLMGDVDRVASYHYTMCGQLAARFGLQNTACLSRRRDAFDFLLEGESGSGRPGENLLFVRDNRYNEQGPDRIQCARWGRESVIDTVRGGRRVRWMGLRVCYGFERIKPADDVPTR